MNDLDTLRPEVRDTLDWIEAEYPEASTIRAELLRLAAENAAARGALETLDVEGHKRAEKVEAELAALKARIAGSAHVEVTLGCAIDGEIPPDLALCKVALVKVEE